MIENLKSYYKKGLTLDYDFRIAALEKLEKSILNHYDELIEAFNKDYHKCEFDVVSSEISLVLNEIRYFKKNLNKLMQPKRVRTSLINIPSKGYIINEPYGVVLIASPWNYPFQLAFMPLVASIASGNVNCLKVSDQTKNIKHVIKNILSVFPSEYIYLVGDSIQEREQLFDEPFDYIFYTGSSKIATTLMEKQAKYLTPLTLELGGKSPCIIDKDANIEKASKRVVWGKYLNAGQTCVAPDYILVEKSVKEQFVNSVIRYIKEFYYKGNELTNNFTHVINNRHIERLKSLLVNENVIFGGNIKNDTLEPTVVDNVSVDSLLMQEEIFGPIMPIIEYENIDDVIEYISSKDKPLAFYIFSKNTKRAKDIISKVSFGGGCINDVIMHVSEENLPFGGVGKSGMNSYHGKKSYDTFTHSKSILDKHHKLELNLKYPPYTNKKLKLVKWFFKIKK